MFMKKKMLASAICLGAIGVSAIGAPVTPMQECMLPTSVSVAAKGVQSTMGTIKAAKVISSEKIGRNTLLQVGKSTDGLKFKRLVANLPSNGAINPRAAKKSVVSRDANSDVVLSEGFEGLADGTPNWQPEGWTIESKLPVVSDGLTETWFVGPAMDYCPSPTGTYMEYCYYSSDEKDEWLISPSFTVEDDVVLMYNSYVEPIWCFDFTYLDWDTYEFSQYEVIHNFQVMVKAEDDAEWTVLKDLAEESKAYSGMELLLMSDYEMHPASASLAAYAGKKVQVAFRYSGHDGNIAMLDDVFVGRPPLDVKFSLPLGTMYYGIDEDFSGLNFTIATGPVYTPLTWMNDTENYEADFVWNYHDPVTNDWATTTERDLTLTMIPDYSSEFTCRNNLFNPPTLTGSAAGFSEGSMTAAYNYYQAGGRAEIMMSDQATGVQTLGQFGMSVFDPNAEGFDYMFARDDDYNTVALYGYNEYTDKFYTDYTFGGMEEPGEGVKLVGIMNYQFSTGAPIVISGAVVHGYGKVSDDAVFKFEIITLDDEGVPANVVAQAECKGSDIKRHEYAEGYMAIPFRFSEPVVMGEDDYMYITRFSGFNDPVNVESFVPFQSTVDNPAGYALGWIDKAITMEGRTRNSYTPTAYYTGYHSFSMMLDATYPWLVADTDEVVISQDGVQEVSLGSYYDGSELSVGELPEWLDVAVTGRYGDAKAVFTATGDQASNCVVSLSAPGVSKEFAVAYDGTASVDAVSAATDRTVVGVTTLSGQTLNADAKLAPGVYVVRYSDGTAAKKLVK